VRFGAPTTGVPGPDSVCESLLSEASLEDDDDDSDDSVVVEVDEGAVWSTWPGCDSGPRLGRSAMYLVRKEARLVCVLVARAPLNRSAYTALSTSTARGERGVVDAMARMIGFHTSDTT